MNLYIETKKVIRSPEDFKKQAELFEIHKWPVRLCSICEVSLEWLINRDKEVFFNSGCGCVDYDNIQARSWESLAAFYNLQDHPATIKKFNEFWRFTTEEKN